MNKFLLLCVFAAQLCSVNVQAQKRTVLIEDFTNMGCLPCAGIAPILDNFVDKHLGDVIAVKYHGNYPAKNDWFYLENQDDIEKRKAFYDISAYPTTIYDGQEQNARYESLMAYYLDECLKVEPSFNISIDASINNKILDYKVTASPLEDMTGRDIRLFLVVIEEYMKNDPVWANGETEARYTARKIIPGGDGYSLGDNIVVGQDYTLEGECSVDNMYDVTEAGYVAFVQDMDSKQVLATCYVPRKAKEENSASIKSVEDLPELICLPNFYAKVKFRNTGSATLKSATLNVDINGSTVTYPWTGSLEYLQNDSVSIEGFTDFNFAKDNVNNVKMWLSDINGTDTESEAYDATFTNSIQAKGAVQLQIFTDQNPQETTWKLFDSEGNVIQEGGPYSEPETLYKEDLMIDKDDCYMLEFYDSANNGITGFAGKGYYQLFQINPDGEYLDLGKGTYKFDAYDVPFRVYDADITLGVDGISKNSEGTVMVYDERGMLLLKTSTSSFNNNTLNSLGKGVRLVKVVSGDNVETSKVLVK